MQVSQDRMRRHKISQSRQRDKGAKFKRNQCRLEIMLSSKSPQLEREGKLIRRLLTEMQQHMLKNGFGWVPPECVYFVARPDAHPRATSRAG
jgi:hypothetical protein